MEPKDITNLYDADRLLPKPRLGETFAYARKSNATENCRKSITDQHRANRRTCERHGLALDDACLLSEKPGLGGDLWWSNVSMGTELAGEERRFRPAFSELRDAILDGRCKAVVCWSQCRLFRNVSIANEFIELCLNRSVRVYDGGGLMDIWSTDGRAHIRHMASDNQRMREKAFRDSKRGTDDAMADEELVVVAGRLGFRSGGKNSRKAVPIPHEIEHVKRIFRGFVHGLDEQGPMTIKAITRMLNEDADFAWAPDLSERRGQRNEHTKGNVYRWQVRRLLLDKSYRALQTKYKRTVRCPAFLVDGECVIDEATWDLAQEKLSVHAQVPPARGREDRAFSGLVRCGVCGQTMGAQFNSSATDRKEDPTAYAWGRYPYDGSMTCQHELSRVPVHRLDAYFDGALAPLALSELEARASAASASALLARAERLEREISAVAKRLADEIPRMALELSPATVARAERLLLDEEARLRREARDVEGSLRSTEPLRKRLADLASLPSAMRDDVVRQTIQWVAVLPPTAGMEWCERYKRLKRPKDAGRLLVLTRFGAYHTVSLDRLQCPDNHRARRVSLRPSGEDEVVGTANDLPDPIAFVRGLLKTCASAGIAFDPTAWCPGLDPAVVAAASRYPSAA